MNRRIILRIISPKMKSGAAGNLVSNDERKRRQEGKGIRKIADPVHSGRRGIQAIVNIMR